MNPAPDAYALAVRVAEMLAARKLPYAIGGSLALNLWSVPRATVDVDVNVFVPPGRAEEVLDALGVSETNERLMALGRGRTEGQFTVVLDGLRVCVFLSIIPELYERIRGRSTTVSPGGPTFLDPVGTAFFKLVFRRTKDVADLERLFHVTDFSAGDISLLRAWMVECFGEDDDRLSLLARLVAQVPA